ncbi:hypothetical protein BH10CYA1_BH10CYA1_27420 [soil metagenome]
MAEQIKQSADDQTKNSENQVAKSNDKKNGAQEVRTKRPYVKPTLRKFSQIDYVTAYGVD